MFSFVPKTSRNWVQRVILKHHASHAVVPKNCSEWGQCTLYSAKQGTDGKVWLLTDTVRTLSVSGQTNFLNIFVSTNGRFWGHSPQKKPKRATVLVWVHIPMHSRGGIQKPAYKGTLSLVNPNFGDKRSSFCFYPKQPEIGSNGSS